MRHDAAFGQGLWGFWLEALIVPKSVRPREGGDPWKDSARPSWVPAFAGTHGFFR